MTVEEAQKLLPAEVTMTLNKTIQRYTKVYRPGEDNPYGLWLNEAQYLEMAKAKKGRGSC